MREACYTVRRPMTSTRMLVLGCTVALVSACGPGDRKGNGTVDAAPAIDSSGGGVDTPNQSIVSQVYAHSGNTLYQIDTQTLQAHQVGPLTGLVNTESLTDLAVDNQNHMVGISLKNLYTIDPTTGTVLTHTSLAATAKGFTALSYIPAATAGDPDVLVTANSNGDVFSIDPVAGTATQIGSYGTTAGGDVIRSSGDLVGIEGLGIYATVDVGTQTGDYLAKIDPANGYKATLIGTGTGYDNIFGLGFWAGKLYGFVDIKGANGAAGSGKVILIDAQSGAGTTLLSNDIEWYGAGVETNAPIIQ